MVEECSQTFLEPDCTLERCPCADGHHLVPVWLPGNPLNTRSVICPICATVHIRARGGVATATDRQWGLPRTVPVAHMSTLHREPSMAPPHRITAWRIGGTAALLELPDIRDDHKKLIQLVLDEEVDQ